MDKGQGKEDKMGMVSQEMASIYGIIKYTVQDTPYWIRVSG